MSPKNWPMSPQKHLSEIYFPRIGGQCPPIYIYWGHLVPQYFFPYF